MSVLLSKLLLVYKNDDADANAGTYPRDSVSSMECLAAETEFDFPLNNNANVSMVASIVDSPDSVLYADAVHSIRILDDMISKVEEAVQNNNVNDEDNKAIEKLISKFATCLVDNVFKQPSCPKSPGCEFLYNESFHLEKGVKFKISMEVHHQYSSSARSINVSLCEDKELSSLLKEVAAASRSYRHHDNIFVKSDKVGKDSTMLALPPRLQQASYRNPLHLNSESTHPRTSCCPRVLSAKQFTSKIVVNPALHNAMKIQKDFMLKLWARGRHMMRTGKPKFQRPVCLRPLCEGDPDFRTREWFMPVAIKFRSKLQKLMCARRSLSSPTS